MDRRIRHTLRAGATVVAATAGLSVLTYTGQTTNGFIPTDFSGPLSAFTGPSTALPADVFAIGDGSGDAGELAALLKATAPQFAQAAGAPVAAAEDVRISVVPGSTPNSTQLSLLPAGPNAAASATTTKAALQVGSSPVLDAQGNPDCSAAVSCVTDPVTNITTVTLRDGVVALVQKVNDITLIAYKTVRDAITGAVDALSLPGQSIPTTIQAMVPDVPSLNTLLPDAGSAAKAPMAAAAVAAPAGTTPDATPAEPTTSAVSGQIAGNQPTAAPSATRRPTVAPDLTGGADRPRVTVTRPPKDFGTGRTGNPTGTSISPVAPGAMDSVRGAVGNAIDAVRDALKPGGDSTGDAPASGGGPRS